ncbi:hypothetical protein [Kitasatospora sp. NPDC097691]|uniref:hypothetical protein n=1 Tax=Kitasatospora sp. NPDC097691 TaxID=3157231 RepID=UPI003316905D
MMRSVSSGSRLSFASAGLLVEAGGLLEGEVDLVQLDVVAGVGEEPGPVPVEADGGQADPLVAGQVGGGVHALDDSVNR